MAIVDAKELETERVETDVCIVGGGAAGITLADALSGGSRDVCLVESGDSTPDWDTQELYDLTSTGYPIRENFMSRARYFGGSCNLWAGRSMLLSLFDVGERGWAGCESWPIDYQELCRYFEPAAELLGLPPVDWFDEQTYLSKMTAVESELFAGPALSPTVSLWGKKPKRFAADHKTDLSRSPNTQVLLNGNVVSLELSENGNQIQSAMVKTLTGKTLRIEAQDFVLACGGLENARLLLASRDRQPEGVGNRHDLVGRFYMDHPRCVYGTVKLSDRTRLKTLSGFPFRHGKSQLGIRLSTDIQRQEGLLNHYATLEAEFSQYAEASYQSFVQTMKVLLRRGYAGKRRDVGHSKLTDIPDLIYLLTPKELVPHSVYRFYWELRHRLLRQRASGNRIVVYFCEQPPNRESRVVLSDAIDPLGSPRLELQWQLGPEVERTLYRFHSLLQQRLAESGLGVLETPDSQPIFTDASHHMGTTRMSVSPRSGVVDVDCKVHGLENLFISGSSVFPNGSHVSPTLAIVALSLRLADRLKSHSR